MTYAESRYRRGLTILDSTRGWAGIIIEPVPVPVPVRAGAGGDKEESANPPRRLQRELLGESTTPGQPEDVQALVTQASHHGSDPRGQPSDGVRQWGCGAPPTPGTSNLTTPRPGWSASMSGWRVSRLASIPLHSRSGGSAANSPHGRRTETRTGSPRTVSMLIASGPAVPSTGHCSGATPRA